MDCKSIVTVFVFSILLAVLSVPTEAQEIVAKVEQVEGTAVTIRLTSKGEAKVGDRITIFVAIPGVGKANVATGQVTALGGETITGIVESSTGRVQAGQLVSIEASKPTAGTESPRSSANWGKVHNPDGDCSFVRDSNRVTIKVPAGRHDLYFGNKNVNERNNAPRLTRQVSGDFVAQVRVTADWTLRTPLSNNQNTFAAGLAIVASPQHYLRHERILFRHRQQGTAATFVPPIYDVDGKRRIDIEVATPDYFPGRSTWLRIRRAGQLVSTYTSQDGKQWQLTRTVVTELPVKVQVGIHALNASGSEFTVDFDDYELHDSLRSAMSEQSVQTSPGRVPTNLRFPPFPSITPDQPWLGMSNAYYDLGSVRVLGLLPNGPAAKAGLSVNDIVRSIDGKKIEELLNDTIDSLKAGQTITLEVDRDGKQLEIPVKLEAIPPDGGNARILAAAQAGEAWAMSELGSRLIFAGTRETGWPYLSLAQKNVEGGIAWMDRAVKAGNAHAALYLGMFVYRSEINDQPGKSIEYIEKARSLSNYGDRDRIYKDATNYLADESLEHGDLPLNPTRAITWYRELAKLGDVEAANELGSLYEFGSGGVPKDQHLAMKWYEVAAKAGSASAQCAIGKMAYNGEGVEKDYATAIAWFKLAAEGGDSLGMYYLGASYEYGRGVELDLKTARRWYQKSIDASGAGAPAARVMLDLLDKKEGR